MSSFRYSGIVHSKTVGIVPTDKKGFTVVLKTKKNQVSSIGFFRSIFHANFFKMMSIFTESSMIDQIYFSLLLSDWFFIICFFLNNHINFNCFHVIFIVKFQNKPAKSSYKITYNEGSRRSLKKLRNTLVHNHYRNDLKQVNFTVSYYSKKKKTKNIQNRMNLNDDS